MLCYNKYPTKENAHTYYIVDIWAQRRRCGEKAKGLKAAFLLSMCNETLCFGTYQRKIKRVEDRYICNCVAAKIYISAIEIPHTQTQSHESPFVHARSLFVCIKYIRMLQRFSSFCHHLVLSYRTFSVLKLNCANIGPQCRNTSSRRREQYFFKSIKRMIAILLAQQWNIIKQCSFFRRLWIFCSKAAPACRHWSFGNYIALFFSVAFLKERRKKTNHSAFMLDSRRILLCAKQILKAKFTLDFETTPFFIWYDGNKKQQNRIYRPFT